MISFLTRRLRPYFSDTRFSEILRGSIWALAARLLAALLTLVVGVVVARGYGAGAMGVLATVQSYLALATIFTVLGTNTSILRLIPEHVGAYSVTSAFRVYRKTQYLVTGVALVVGVLLFLLSGVVADRIFSKPHLSFSFALAACFVVFKSLMDLNTQAVRGLRIIRFFAFLQVLPALAMLVVLVTGTLLFPVKDGPVYAQLAAWACTAALGAWVMNRAFRQRMQPGDRVRDVPVREILSISLPMLMTTSLHVVIAQTGVIMLAAFRSEAEVGYYDMTVKLATLASYVLTSVNSMAGPRFSELFHSGRIDELFFVAKKSAKLIFWTTAPLLLGLVLLGKPILRTLFGQEFVAAYPALVFLALGQFVNSTSGSTGMFMNMTGSQTTFRTIMLVAALLNVSLNAVAIPSFGVTGAAFSAMTSVIFWNIATLACMKARHGRTTGYLPGFSGWLNESVPGRPS
jgi:O-antigen/teichoic acid export membrane protein